MGWRRVSIFSAGCVLAIGLAGAAPRLPERLGEQIRQAEYEFTANDGAFYAPNRAQGFRSRLDRRGLEMTDRLEGSSAWRLHMSLAGWGRDGSLSTAAAPAIRAESARVEMVRPGLEEWFVSSPEGLEHGFEIERSPAGGNATGQVVLDLAFDGSLKARQDGSAVVFDKAPGEPKLRYGQVRVVDGAGHGLPATLALQGDAIRIRIDDAGAVYPLSVDPLMTNPAATIDGDQPDASFALSLGAGDLNGDGYADLAVGAPYYDSGVDTDAGRVYVIFGSSNGLDANLNDAWHADPNKGYAHFGYSVAVAGDVNGDQIDDLLVGAPQYDEGETVQGGYAFAWYGPLDANNPGTPTNANWRAHGLKDHADFGWSVAGAGDVNGDQIADVIVGAPRYQNDWDTDEGWVFVWEGSNDGLEPSPGLPGNAPWYAQSNRAGALLGYSVAGAGDVDGDGYDDVIAGAPLYSGTNSGTSEQGRIFIWRGSGAGPHGGVPGSKDEWDWGYKSSKKKAHLGLAVASAGDVDGNGASDILAGAPDYYVGGAAFVWEGTPGVGLPHAASATKMLTEASAAWSVVSNVDMAKLGFSVSSAGNVDGYDTPAVIIGAPDYFDPYAGIDSGTAFVWYACPGQGLSQGPADWFAENVDPNHLNPLQGEAVAGGADFDGDGIDDIVIGVPYHESPAQATLGRVLVYAGADDTPGVQVLSPNGGEILHIGDLVTLQWSATNRCDVVPSVDLLLSRNGPGGPFETLFQGLQNTGSQTWMVSGPDTNQAVLKVVAHGPGGSTGMDLSDAVFSIHTGQCTCPVSYCESVGRRCTFNGDCNGCCHYTCTLDDTCTSAEQNPNAC